MDGKFGWWFTGFVDGEGCFDIKPVGEHFICRFTIGLRMDDVAVLERIQLETGVGDIRIQRMRNGAVDQARWEVARKAEVGVLVGVFDQFPPQSKKARDYEIWREAVSVWQSAKPGNRWSGPSPHTAELRRLRQALRIGRSSSLRSTASPISVVG